LRRDGPGTHPVTRVLVVGAAGFVGANLLRDLMRRPGIDAMGWIRRGGNAWRLTALEKPKVLGHDIADAQYIATLRPDIVINAAAVGVTSVPTLDDAYRVNVDSVVHLLAAAGAAGVKRFIQLGSYFEYGDQTGVLHEDGPLLPKTTYAATKAAASILTA